MNKQTLSVLLAVCAFATGCNATNGFFGSSSPTPTAASLNTSLDLVPASMVGGWSYIDVLTSASNNPNEAFLSKFTFTSTGDSRFEYVDLLKGGLGVDVYGPAGFDNRVRSLVMAFTRGFDPTGGFIGTLFELLSPTIDGSAMYYGASTAQRVLYAGVQGLEVIPPQGVWRFDGAFGIDFVVITRTGYAVIQSRDDSNEPFLLDAVVSPSTDGSLRFDLFNTKPEDISATISFDSYSIDGSGALVLTSEERTVAGPQL